MTASEISVKERSHLANRRYRFFTIAFVVGIFLTFLAILIPVLVIRALDLSREAKHRAEEVQSLYEWTQLFDLTIFTGTTQVHGLEGFVFSNLSSIPPINGTPEERIEGQYYSRFDSFVQPTYSPTVEIQLQALCPGGVYSQMNPFNQSLYKKILFEYPDQMYASIEYGKVFADGPSQSYNNSWIIAFVNPIFNTTTFSDQSEENFWGFVVAWVSITDTIAKSGLPDMMKDHKIQYLLYTMKNGIYNVIDTSLSGSLSTEDIRRFESAPASVMTNETGLNLVLVVLKDSDAVVLNRSMLVILVVFIATLGIVLTAVAIVIIAACTNAFDGIEHAPKSPPFAMLIIGPQNGEDLWIMAPDQMCDVTEKLAKVLEKKMKHFRAYQVPQLQPYTTTYILRRTEDAVKMAFSVIEELQANPVDEQLEKSLGSGCKGLFISYAVHWCKTGNVLLGTSSAGERLRYESQEILHAVSMWRKSPPSIVVISESAKVHVSLKFAVQFFRPAGSVSEDGVEAMYFVFDPSRPLLHEAKAKAEKNANTSLQGILYPYSSSPSVYSPHHLTKEKGSPHPNSPSAAPLAVDGSLHANPSGNSLEEVVHSRRGAAGRQERGGRLNLHREFTLPGNDEDLEAFSKALMEPKIPSLLLNALRSAFDHQWLTLGISFDSVKVMVYYFYSCFKLIFKPLAAPQRHNIFLRLVTAFGVPQDGLLEHLAAHCTIRYIQQQQETKALYRESSFKPEKRKKTVSTNALS